MGLRTLGATARAGRELSRIRMALRTGDPAAITAGAQGLIRAVSVLPDGNEVRQVSLDTVHDEITYLCEHGTGEQLERAVLACQAAVAAVPPSEPGLLARLLVDEAMALLTRFERTGSAGPVLDELGLTGTPGQDEPWPRIWWSPSGLLSFLPLHAAGHHDTRFDASPQTVLDRVASSYTATARALLHARGQTAGDPSAAGGLAAAGGPAAPAGQVLVVAMQHTPGAPDLAAAPQEASLLTGLFGERALVLHDQDDAQLATASSVLAALPQYPWAHFACHAATVLRDPSASYLVLHDHASSPLTVLDISRQRLQGAEFAFLSACSTASADGRLPDEAINLASAFQLAGYRRVVATMWSVDDGLAAGLARQFYTELKTAGASAAGVLHDSARLYRTLYAGQPSMWAAHLHAGL